MRLRQSMSVKLAVACHRKTEKFSLIFSIKNVVVGVEELSSIDLVERF